MGLFKKKEKNIVNSDAKLTLQGYMVLLNLIREMDYWGKNKVDILDINPNDILRATIKIMVDGYTFDKIKRAGIENLTEMGIIDKFEEGKPLKVKKDIHELLSYFSLETIEKLELKQKYEANYVNLDERQANFSCDFTELNIYEFPLNYMQQYNLEYVYIRLLDIDLKLNEQVSFATQLVDVIRTYKELNHLEIIIGGVKK